MNALEERVLHLIGENVDSPDVFTDDDEGMAPIREAINEAIAEVILLTGGNKRQYFLPLREGIAFYRLRPANGSVGWITDVWSHTRQQRLSQTDFTQLSTYDPRWMIYTGDPESYLPIGADVIGFYPKPSGSANVMELTLVEIPAAYTSDRDRIRLRDSYQYAVVNYAVAEFWASRGDAAEAQKHFSMYLDGMGLKQRYMPQAEATRTLDTRKEFWPRTP